MKQCPICGSKFAGTESFCPHDGAHLVEAEQPAQLLGKTLHDLFKLETLLYKDAFGERYAGRLLSDGTSVKITVFNQAFTPEQARVASLVTAKTLLDEPMPAQIATTHGWDIDAEPAYLVESLPKGPSLRVLLDERGTLDWRTAVKITCSLARRLEWMDNLGVTHRMLQPEVVSITQIKRGDVHLGEWALGALSFTDDPLEAVANGQLVAAAAYMAPELIDGNSKADRRSQIYALGLLLYEMLTGKSPFKSSKTEETLKRQRRERPVKLSISYEGEPLPETLDDLFEVMTSKLPEQRFQALGALVNALSSTLDDGTTPADFPEIARDDKATPVLIKKSDAADESTSGEDKERKHTLLFISAEDVKKAQAEAKADAPDVEDAQKSTLQMDSSVLADDIARARDRPASASGESSTSEPSAASADDSTSKKKKKKKKSKSTIRLNASDLPSTSNLVGIDDPESKAEDDDAPKSTIVISKDFADEAIKDHPADRKTTPEDSAVIDDAAPKDPPRSKGISGSSVTEAKESADASRPSSDKGESISIKDALDAGHKTPAQQDDAPAKKEEPRKAPVTASSNDATVDDDHWFSTDSEGTWDQEILMEHEERTNKKFKTYLIVALVLFILSLIVGAVLVATAPESDEEASLTPDHPASLYYASLTTLP